MAHFIKLSAWHKTCFSSTELVYPQYALPWACNLHPWGIERCPFERRSLGIPSLLQDIMGFLRKRKWWHGHKSSKGSYDQERVTRVRACNYVKIEAGQNFPAVLKIVTRILHRLRKMLILLSVHMTSVLFLVWFNNFALTMSFYGVTRSYSSRPFLCVLVWYNQ